MFDNTIIIILIQVLTTTMANGQSSHQSITQNGMTVSWSFDKENIVIEMEAPTQGWIAIGFNETSELTNTYLIMGAVTNGKAEVKEHHVFKPGDYQSFEAIGEPESITEVSGSQTSHSTSIQFSLPTSSFFQYSKTLKPNTEITMLIAYSQKRDFQHHSIMRTSINVKL